MGWGGDVIQNQTSLDIRFGEVGISGNVQCGKLSFGTPPFKGDFGPR